MFNKLCHQRRHIEHRETSPELQEIPPRAFAWGRDDIVRVFHYDNKSSCEMPDFTNNSRKDRNASI